MHLTRRSALASAGLALVTACTRGRRSGPAPAPDPDAALAAAAVARELALLARYDDALAAVPALAGELAPLRAEHVAHLAALGAVEAAAATPTRPPSPPAPSPGTAVQVRRDLASREHEAAAGHAAAAVAASRRLAPVLASLAASEASHAAVL